MNSIPLNNGKGIARKGSNFIGSISGIPVDFSLKVFGVEIVALWLIS